MNSKLNESFAALDKHLVASLLPIYTLVLGHFNYKLSQFAEGAVVKSSKERPSFVKRNLLSPDISAQTATPSLQRVHPSFPDPAILGNSLALCSNNITRENSRTAHCKQQVAWCMCHMECGMHCNDYCIFCLTRLRVLTVYLSIFQVICFQLK